MLTLSAIVGFLKVVPQLVSLLTDVWNYLQKISGNDAAGYIVKVGAAFSQLNAAQTEADHAASAKALADAISGAPSK